MPDFSTKQRENLAEKGQAMPSGAFPIRNRADLKRAIQAFGRAKNPEKTKAWIIHRARQLDAMDLIPEKWLEEKKITHVWERDMTIEADVQDFLAHYGKKGMKWGRHQAQVTRAENKESKANEKVSSIKSDASATRKDLSKARGEAREARANVSNAKFNAAGKSRIDNSGGSKALANTKVIGRTIGLNVLAGVAGNLAYAAMSNNPTAKAAIAIGTSAFQVINTTMGVRDVIGVSIQPSSKKG